MKNPQVSLSTGKTEKSFSLSPKTRNQTSRSASAAFSQHCNGKPEKLGKKKKEKASD